MIDKQNQRLEELKKIVKDKRLEYLVVKMVDLEQMLDQLSEAEKIHQNPNNPAQVKISQAFFAYHKTLGAYKECVKLLLSKTDDDSEESPLREYLRKVKNKDDFTE